MRLKPWLAAMLVMITGMAGTCRAVTNVFEYPLVFRQHQAFVQEMQQAMQRRDSAEMERVCRSGVALLPENPVWRYNLACALAQQAKQAEALIALDQAVERGFRDADAIQRDNDFAGLRAQAGFRAIVTKARELGNTPVAGQPVIMPTIVSDGVARVSAANTMWDFDLGHFRAFFALPTNRPSDPSELAAGWTNAVAPEVRAWLVNHQAAGNWGDYYDNRDDGHSRLDIRPFAGLTAIQYGDDARRAGAHYGMSAFLYNGVVIGNSSVAITTGPYWRSAPREALSEGHAMGFLVMQYLNNQMYCYPSHHDHEASGFGDLYPVNQPYILISQGSSWSDQPMLQALAATLAAFKPDTKHFLISHGLLMPTMQMILRVSQKAVMRPEDYLSGQAHPTAFDGANLDVSRMVRLAQSLTTNDVPPLVVLRTLEDHLATPGIDFFDLVSSDAQYDTPCAISRIMRSVAFRHTMTVGAGLSGVSGDGWRLHWMTLRGDPRRVTLLPLTPDQTQMSLSVAYPGGCFPVAAGHPLKTSRVDVGVFASNGRLFSAPSFVSFFYLNNEVRTYSDDGRILAVDYAAAATTNRYVDPVLSLPKLWRDDYTYDANNQLTGWTRHRGAQSERFTPRGERIEKTDALDRATITRIVTYLPRSSSNGVSAPDLVQMDGGFRITYRYISDLDTTGEILTRERVSP